MKDLTDKQKNILEWIYCIIAAIIICVLLKYFIGTGTMVQQKSMMPTLMPGQRLWINRWPRTIHQMPKRGDIITFESPSTLFIPKEVADLSNPIAKYENDPQDLWSKFVHYVLEINKVSFIKRVIGLPGDHVKIENGKVYINDEELKEDYLPEGLETPTTEGAFIDIVVPENCVFAMGDNRPNSVDCRRFGCIPLEKIESRVLFRFWPLNLFGKVV